MSLLEILTVLGTLTSIFSLTSYAANIPSNALDLSNDRFKIELIDVKCDKNEDGMQVTVQFAEPFDGIIYSQRYFSDPNCRYVSAGQSEKTYNFIVPYKGCGSKPTCEVCDTIDNILIIQQDEELQGEFDAARKISCSRSGIDEEKKIFFKPFAVDMLDVVTVPTANGGVDCWMDIKRGTFPQLSSIGDVIKIGEALTVMVFLRDQQKQYDLSVRNCWAYDSEDFDDKNTNRVQLSDASGCSMKRRLFGSWQKTPETGSTDATLLLHNSLRAFKFPDEAQIYLKCDIEICRGSCAEAICDADELKKVDCTVDPLNPKCMKKQSNGRVKPPGITPAPFRPTQSLGTSRITTRLPLLVTTRRPSFDISTTERFGYTSTPTPNRAFETTQALETTTYREITTSNPTTARNGYNTFCALYPKSKRCNQVGTDDSNANADIPTLEPPRPFESLKNQPTTIAPGSENEIVPTTDSRANEPPLICKGENLDPRCPNPTPTNTPPTYLPPSTTMKMIISRIEASTAPPSELTTNQPTTTRSVTDKPTEKLFICVPGSNDVNCDSEATKATGSFETTTFIPSRNQITTEKLICSPGSRNPECQKIPTTFKPRSSSASIPPIGSRENVPTTARPPVCYPGSLDPRCPRPTSKKPNVQFPSKPVVDNEIPVVISPVCFPGSTDSRCPKARTSTTTKPIVPSTIAPAGTTTAPDVTTTAEIPTSTPFRIIVTTNVPPKPTTIIPTTSAITTTNIPTTENLSTNAIVSTTFAPRCYPGSLDPRCSQTTIKTDSIGTTTQVYTEIPTTESVTTSNSFSTTNAPRTITNTQTAFTTFGTKSPFTTKLPTTTEQPTERTTNQPTTVRPPICYPGSFDPKCAKKTPAIGSRLEASTEIPSTTSFGTVPTINTAPRCYLGSTDPRCSQTTIATQPTLGTTQAPLRCYPGSSDPLCSSKKEFNPAQCGSGLSLDPRCPNPTPTAEPATYLPPFTNNAFSTTKPPGNKPTIPFNCQSNSFDPRCRGITTNSFGRVTTNGLRTTSTYSPSATSQASTEAQSTTRAPFTFPAFTTRRVFSSPQPFATRPPTPRTTTENILCYPGSTIEGCKSSFTTPSFCYPGSKDPRCPQLPPSFSTRVPATYLPPYPDVRFNRVKRQTSMQIDDSKEVVKFSLSFKPFSRR